MNPEPPAAPFPTFALGDVATALFDAAVDGMVVIGVDGRIRTANASAQALFGYSLEELVGQNVSMLMPRPEAVKHDGYLDHYVKTGAARIIGIGRDVQGMHSTGESFAMHLSVGEAWVAGERLFVGICRDMRESRRMRDEVDYLASHDRLTRCYNRHAIESMLARALTRASEAQEQIGVLYIDFDNFKQINDTLGHSVGDAVLRQVAWRLRRCVRGEALLGRVGGDEFLVFLTLSGGRNQLEALAQRVVASFAEPLSAGEHMLALAASVGVSLYPEPARSRDALLRYADLAMSDAKARGGNTYVVFDGDLARRAERRSLIVARLRWALRNEGLMLHYQPQHDLHTGRLVGLEALLRWEDERLGRVTPGEFIPLAEQHGLMPQLSLWVLRRACHDHVRLLAEGVVPAVPVAVNLSTSFFQRPDFLSHLEAILGQAQLPGQYLELEVTEDVMLHNSDRVRTWVQALKALGVRLAVDDFGTGFSSLSYLKDFAFDTLKIDRSFVQGLPGVARDRIIVSAMLRLAHALGLVVVAEGVETVEQQQLLAELGCDVGQGFLYAPALPLAALPEYLAQRSTQAVLASSTE